MRAAFALRINSGRMIFNLQFWKICGFSRIAFSREGAWRETVVAAPLSAKARRCGRARSPERADFPRPGEDVTAGDKKGNLSRSD